MKRRGKNIVLKNDSDEDVEDIFTDEINEFTEARNKIHVDEKASASEEEEEIFGLVDEDDESDEEIGEWSKRLKQIKFQAKLEKNKSLPGDAPEKSWGNKRSIFYGSGVKRKPKQAENEEEDEWLMEEKEIEKLQKKLDADVDEDDFMVPSLVTKTKSDKSSELTVKRDLNLEETVELKKKLHPEAEPLREELNKCIEELEKFKDVKGWKAESRNTCFKLLAANIAFYLHLIDNNEDCRGHPVIKRIVQWKKMAKMYEAIPAEQMHVTDEEDNGHDDENEGGELSKDLGQTETLKRKRLAVDDSEEEGDDDLQDEEKDFDEPSLVEGGENRPITYEIEKNKPKKKSAPNNPRVKHREKFRKAKIRRRGKIREYKPEINKYQGEASGIRTGIIRSIKLK
ncbi:something about silencing protein 10-like [Physella acuta]|uniref:something about silencing protein 10-like n=1 Tax=Physella acuta TaxID=109671 RepID=UPI0027DAEAE7|nr:something about silencing protein 10-like [Physella acuta]